MSATFVYAGFGNSTESLDFPVCKMGIKYCSGKVKRVNSLMFIKCYEIFIVYRTYNKCNQNLSGSYGAG